MYEVNSDQQSKVMLQPDMHIT